KKPFLFTARGNLRGENISLPLKQGVVLTIKTFSLAGEGNRLAIDSASLMVDNDPLSLQGSLTSTPEDMVIDMDLSADRIEWGKIAKTLEAQGKRENNNTWDLPVKGALRLKANAFTYDKYSWVPLRADIAIHRNDVAIVVTDATLCGISSPGMLMVTPEGLSLDFQLTADNQELEPTLDCLVADRELITGRFDLKGTVKGQGGKETLVDSFQGTVEFVAKDGRIYRELSLLKIFDFLEINQILRGFHEMRQKGLPYQSIKAKGELKAGRLEVKEGIMDGSSMKIAVEGYADLNDKKIDFTDLLCPLTKTDFMIKMIPFLGRILGDSFISIPLDVTGDLNDPKVRYQPVSAVGSGLLGIIKRTIETPVRLFDPFSPGEKK
ncbi:MAG: AsmA-like C-terminal domain-containing protein, partial [Thermodesulfovibrionales bacterium]